MSKLLPLSGEKGAGLYAIISKEDYDSLSIFKWHLSSRGYPSTWYKGKTYSLHVFVLGKWADHINNNKLDNRRENLRLVDNQRNSINKIKGKGKLHGGTFRGVRRRPGRARWIAEISIGNNGLQIGTYETEEEAARAYDAVAAQWHGPYSKLNFPGDIDNLLRPR